MSSLMICGIATPSACEKSRSVTPDSTVAGPVGATTSRGWRGPRSAGRSLGRWRWPVPGRPPPPSMTTRRRPFGPPPRGLIGLFGLPFAIDSGTSVETRERRVDADGLPEDAVERPPADRPLEAGQPPAGICATAEPRAVDERTVVLVETLELGLRGLAAAAGAGADGVTRPCRPPSRPERRRRD